MSTIASRFLVALTLLALPVQAHDVIWTENDGGQEPADPMVLEAGQLRTFYIAPEINEPCTVIVTIDAHPSILSVTIDGPNPNLEVAVDVQATRQPFDGEQLVTITGSWRATGQPTPQQCAAVQSHPFSVPVLIRSPSSAQLPNAARTGDPVSTATGEITTSAVDLSLGGPLPLAFARAYGSRLEGNSALGAHWMHNFEESLQVFHGDAMVRTYPGAAIHFRRVGGAWLLESTGTVKFQLIPAGIDYDFVDPAASLIRTFSSAGKLVAIRDRNGNTLNVTQGAAGPLSVTDGLGRTLTFAYASNQLTSVTDSSGRSVAFSHSGSDLASVTGTDGTTTTYSYTTGGRLVATTMPAGNTPWRQQFDAAGHVTAQADSFGRSTTIAYDQPVAGARIVTDPLGATSVHLYDDALNLSQLTDPQGRNTLFDYDATSRLVRITDRRGNETDIAYDPSSGHVGSIIDAMGNVTSYAYAAQAQGGNTFFNLTGAHFADGTSIALSRDARGNVVSLTDAAGKLHTRTYNARGQLLTAKDPAGGVVSAAYAADGTPTSVTDAAGNVTSFAFNARRQLSALAFADGTSRSFTYDAVGRPLTSTDERGGVVRVAYDANGNPVSFTNPLNRTVALSYDTDDLVTSVTDATGGVARFEYDGRGSVVASTNAAGETLRLNYDALGRLVSVADPAGQGPSFGYDAEGNLVSSADGLGNAWTFAVDPLGRTTAMTTPKGEVFGRSYDSSSRVVSTTDALARSTSIRYEARGLPTAISLPGDVGAAYAYDDRGLLVTAVDPNGRNWNRQYDVAGRLVGITDPLGRSRSYTYDARGRVKSASSSAGALAITRDAAGNITRRQYTDGLDVTVTYDANGGVTGGSGLALSYDANGRIAVSNGLAITRDPAGRIASIAYAPGKPVTYAYDARGLLASVADWAGGSAAFVYDAAARLLRIDRANGVTTRFTYDANGRLTAIDEVRGATTIASTALERDALGRVVKGARNVPLEPSLSPSAGSRSYDAASQRIGATHDVLGRVTADASRTYEWDLASRLKRYADSGVSVSFGYDAFGLRTSRTPSAGAAESYVLNYALALPSVGVVRVGGSDVRYYVHAPNGSLLYAVDAGGNAHHYYHFDENGSTLFLTGDNGAISDSYGITPYGETVTSNGSTPNPFTWMGRWGVMQEGETGLYYMRARWYDGAAARFLSPDPIRQLDPRAINPYQYASGDPLSRIDPTGTKEQGSGSNPLVPGDLAPGLFGPAAGTIGYWFLQEAAEQAAYAARLEDEIDILNRWSLNWVAECYERCDILQRSPRWLQSYNAALRTGSWLTFDEWVVEDATRITDSRWGGTIERFRGSATGAAAAASRLRNLGNGIAVVGGVVQTGAVLVEDVVNGADIVVTTTDVGATAVSVGALAAAPPLALVDLGTGGAVSGGIHNALMTPNIVARVALGDRFNSGDQAAVKRAYTRFAVGRWVWGAGEGLATWALGE